MAQNGIRFAEGLQVVPLLSPQPSTVDIESAHVKLENLHWLTFIVMTNGDAGSASCTANIYVKSTAGAAGSTAAGDYALPFWYRTATVGTDDWGAITAVSTGTGYVQYTAAQDEYVILIDVDPDVIYAHDSDATHLYIDIDTAGDNATDVNYASVVGVFEPRYPQVEQKSSSAGAT